jgi:hypothetical protein
MIEDTSDMTRRAALRASDADREQVVERLRHAGAEGRLLADELEDRLGAALSARTYGELDAVVSDLPAPTVGHGRRSRGPVGLRPAAAATFAVAVVLVLIATVAFAVSGHSHPNHRWVVGLRGGAPLIWLVWIAIGWRFFARGRGGVR